MSSTLSPEAVTTATGHASDGRFVKGNRGGPGNPFARQTAALRAFLIAHVTERDLQDILDILLLNAKGGHLPTIKFLFAYVLGKPKPVVEPDLLDLQEMQMLQQAAQAPAALETLCDQLPLDCQVNLARFSQAENATTVAQREQEPAGTPASAPSTNGIFGRPHGTATVDGPSPNGVFGASGVAASKQTPSPKGKTQRPPTPSAGFDWLSEWRRAFDSLSPP